MIGYQFTTTHHLCMFYKLSQIQNTNKSVQLVSSKQAPFIISAIMEIFGSEGETPYQRFKSELDLIIKRHDRKDLATSLINEWLRQGWIRESEDVIYSTETFNLAKNFYLASLDPVAILMHLALPFSLIWWRNFHLI